MAGSFRSISLALCAVVFITSNASAFWGRLGWRPVCRTAYSPPPVWCYVPASAPSRAQPIALLPFPPAPAPLTKLQAPAKQLPAKSAATNEPPLRAPAITESRSLGGVLQTQATDVAPGRCKVGFWNITGDDVTLTIDGQTRSLARDRAVTLELERTFVWQLAGREGRTERVPDGQNLFEVILRP